MKNKENFKITDLVKLETTNRLNLNLIFMVYIYLRIYFLIQFNYRMLWTIQNWKETILKIYYLLINEISNLNLI